MRIRFWGVRGSYPVPGPQTNRYGGNTSCVEVRPRNGPHIVIDAGTGLRRLGKDLMLRDGFGEGRGASHLLISHTHWDHIQGLPFFAPLYQSGNKLYVYARRRDDTHLRAVFATQSDDPYFPVPFNATKADVAFRELVEGARFQIGSVKVSCTRLNHPWIAMAYRLECDGASVVYATDTAPFTDILLEHEFIKTPPRVGDAPSPEHASKLRDMREGLIELCRGADLVIYDTQFTPEEYRSRPHWGHSTPDDALEVALAAQARTLALFHYSPERSDDEQDVVLAETRAKVAGTGLEVIGSQEQMELTLGDE